MWRLKLFMENIESAKLKFLNTYNPEKREKAALIKAIGASLGRNKLYKPFLKSNLKLKFKSFWKDRLVEIGEKYIKNQYTESEYLEDVVWLKVEINKKFYKSFTSKADVKDDLNPGFRISHSQKSISVYLKHLWCLNENENPPPQCPVDRKILSIIIKSGKVPSWTKVNTLKSHIELIQLIKTKALIEKYNSIAEWELLNYVK